MWKDYLEQAVPQFRPGLEGLLENIDLHIDKNKLDRDSVYSFKVPKKNIPYPVNVETAIRELALAISIHPNVSLKKLYSLSDYIDDNTKIGEKQKYKDSFQTLMGTKTKKVVGSTIHVLTEDFLYFLDLDLKNIRASNKRLEGLFSNSPRSFEEKMNFYKNLGMSKKDLTRAINKHPNLLTYSIKATIKPKIDFLKKLDIGEEHHARIFTLFPQYLGFNFERTIEPRIRFLKKQRFLDEEITSIIIKQPQVFQYHNELIKGNLDFFKDIGFSSRERRKAMIFCPKLLGLNTERNTIPTYNFLLSKFDMPEEYLKKVPNLLTYSIENRMKPRHQFLKSLKKGLEHKYMPDQVLFPSDEKFCKKFREPYFDYMMFKEEYFAKIELNKKRRSVKKKHKK